MLTVRADFGPKSSLEIHIQGINKTYDFELLYEDVLPEQDIRNDHYATFEEHYGYSIHPLLVNFEEDGFISSALYRGRPTYYTSIDTHVFRYTYVPPRTFKLILIFEDGNYVTSPILTTKLFYSDVTWDLTGVNTETTQSNVGRIREEIPFGRFSLDLMTRILITIGIEMAILLIFKYRKKTSMLLVLLTNLVTQTTLTGFMFAMRYYFSPFFGEIFALIIGEALIFILEGFIYMTFLKEQSKKKALLYTLVANFASLIAGLILMIIFWM